MLTTQGTIVRAKDGCLSVRADCLESCKTCGVQKLCSGSRRTQLLNLPDSSQLSSEGTLWFEGQRVQTQMEEGELLRIALLVYSLPCLLMLFVALLASPWGNIATALGCVLGLTLGIVMSSQIARRKPPQVQLIPRPSDSSEDTEFPNSTFIHNP